MKWDAVYTYEHAHDCDAKGDIVESKFAIEDDAFEKPAPMVCGVQGPHFGEELELKRTRVESELMTWDIRDTSPREYIS